MNKKHQLFTNSNKPAFQEPVHVGQLYFPTREEFRISFDEIFDRRYFTNHGPLVNQLDLKIARYLGVKNAICVTNGTIALMIACAALDLKGSVIVPSFTFPATVQALLWAGLEPIFCDIEPDTHCISPEHVVSLIREDTSGILGVHIWGRPCNIEKLDSIAKERGIKVLYDACHAFGISYKDQMIGNYGELEIFSFHATKVMSSAEGGCITTNNDKLAARLRTVRNFHSSHSEIESPLRINGKMTEAQAAIAKISLKNLDGNIVNNRKLWVAYEQLLGKLPGIEIVRYNEQEKQNFQFCVCTVDEKKFGINRDQLYFLLRAENVLVRRYFYPGVHMMEPFISRENSLKLSNTDELCKTIFQLPLGARVSINDVKTISSLINTAHLKSEEIKQHLQQLQ